MTLEERITEQEVIFSSEGPQQTLYGSFVPTSFLREEISTLELALVEAREALKKIESMTDADKADSYRADDPQGCLDAISALARRALGGEGE